MSKIMTVIRRGKKLGKYKITKQFIKNQKAPNQQQTLNICYSDFAYLPGHVYKNKNGELYNVLTVHEVPNV